MTDRETPTSLEAAVQPFYDVLAWSEGSECSLEGDHAHVLTDGEYSSYTILAVLTADAVDPIRAQIARASTRGSLAVECRPWIGPDLATTIAEVPTPRDSLVLTAGCYWTGDGFHETDHHKLWQPDENLGTDDTDWIGWYRSDCEVRTAAYETSYTLGSSVSVGGLDHDRVRKVYSEQKAHLLADPAGAAIKAWTEHALSHRKYGPSALREEPIGLPYWVWLRDENRPLLDAFRQAGVKQEPIV